MIDQLESLLTKVVGDVEIDQAEAAEYNVAQVTAEENLQLTLAWNTHYMAGNIDCNQEVASDVIQVCNSVGSLLDCGSIFMPSDSYPTALEESGYEKQYIYPLSANNRKIRFGDLPVIGEHFRTFLENHLEIPIELGCSLDERPYIYSMDWQGKYKGKHKFSCYLHFHPLTQSAYLEEIVIPKPLRRKHLGTKVMNILKRLMRDVNCRYLYLSAKQRAEPFWNNQGFYYVYRANLRNEKRRINALKKVPGWERTWFEGTRLELPQWQYRNHPQDDYDLFLALRDQPIEGLAPVTLTAG